MGIAASAIAVPDRPVHGRRLRVALKAIVITTVEAWAGAAVWLTLLLFSRFYSQEAYSRLIPWLACQQLIIVVASFGSTNAIAKLVSGGDEAHAQRMYSFLPRYTWLNLPWTVPLALMLTWMSTRGSFSQASWAEALLAVTSGAAAASLRAQQQVSVLVGHTRRYTIERTSYGLISFATSLLAAMAGLPSLTAFFGGQWAGLAAVMLIRRTYAAVPNTSTDTRGMYREVFHHSWVFGAWSIFGWFSGLGATIVLSRFTTPLAVAVYGQALAAVSLVQLGLGSGATALQSHFLALALRWDMNVERRLDEIFDALIVAGAVIAAGFVMLHAESWRIFSALRLHWPVYIWAYFFSALSALTLYQRVMLRHQYDPAVTLSWVSLAVGEALALSAFGLMLMWRPDMPLAASAALLAARTMTLFFSHEPRSLRAQLRKVRTVALGAALAAAIWRIST